MKTKILLFFLLFGLTRLHAQTYYKIIFSGEPDSILVENLTKGTGLTLQGTDTLSLKLSGVGVQETDRSKRTLIIYPNPMDHSCRFDLENTTQGRVEIQLFNANGKRVHEYNARLSAGMHQFELSGVPAGVYHLQIKTESYRLSGSFVSTYESSPDVRLIHKKESPFRLTKGNADGNQKSAQDDVPLSLRSIVVMDFSTGDQLKFTGYKTNSDDDVEFASPTGDQTIGFTFCVRPFQPSAISGNDNPCAGTTQNYAVTHSDGVTYTWSVPSEWTIVSGQGSSSITVTAGATAGNITVTPSNTCGNGTAQTFTVTTQSVPVQPSAISGIADPCHGTTGLIYAVNGEPGLNYIWTVPTGWTITSGEGTNSITVTAGTSNGNISVIPSNVCGIGAAQTLAVTAQSDPIQPSTIMGKENPCQNSSEIYSVTHVPGMTYTWTVPTDWTISSGQGTNTITVTVGVTTGNILVTPSNNCGTGILQSLAVTTQTGGAGQPSPITGEENPCEGTPGLVYSVVHVDGVNYTWEVPAGWEIVSGQGTNSIIVTAGGASGNVMVTPSNDCGNGVARSLSVVAQTVPEQPSEIEGTGNPCVYTEMVGYSVMAVPGVTYFWTVPAGWIISFGQNTNEIYIVTNDVPGTISVTPSNDCGNGPARTLAVTMQYPPEQPSAINGNAAVCEGETGLTYAVTPVPGVSYNWIIPNDWTITHGQGTNSIIVTAGANSGQIQVFPENECGWGTPNTLPVSSLQIPAQPSAINGNNNPCEGFTGNYSVANVPGVTYNWTVPAGWNIINGQGTNIITVNTGSSAGNITVIPSNDCGNGTARTLAVTTQTEPDQPSGITGNENPCQGETGLSYWVINDPDVTYFWTVPTGWTITSGQNTSSITATAGTASGTITVIPSNDCGNGTARTLMVNTQLVPEQASVISGNTTPCENESGLNYSVTNVSGVTYTWAVPSGWNITNGQGTNSIIVTAGTTSGNITVTPSNDCGNGPVRTLAVTAQLIPAQPSTISGNNNPCQGATGQAYSVTNVPGVSYFWSVPSGWNITNGQGTNSILVTAGTTTGTITVTPSNDCGNGTSRTMAVTTQVPPAQPSAISGNTNPCQGASESYSVTNVSGVTYTWSVPSGWSITNGQGTNSITVTAGSNAGNISVTPSNDCGNGTAQSLAVTTETVPAQPSNIIGNANPCEYTPESYSVTHVSGVTYIWSVPSGWSITNGQGTNLITVMVGSTAGNLSVIPSNDCGNGSAQLLSINTQFVPTFWGISGNFDVCQNETGLIYSVDNIPGVNYLWTVPSGWIITNGQGTNSITANAGNPGWGVVQVYTTNDCGVGNTPGIAVETHAIPQQPSEIIGSIDPCQGASGLIYSVINVFEVTYTWELPSDWIVTAGQGSCSITVTAGSLSGNIIVTPSNSCGNGIQRTLTVITQTVPAQPSAITGNSSPCQGETGIIYSVDHTSGVTYFWTVPSDWTITSGQGTNSIIVTAGITSGNISVTPSNDCDNGTTSTLAVTAQGVPPTPDEGTHVPSQTQIVWNWNASVGATGYKYNTVNNYATAIDNGTSNTYTQTGLTCNTAYTLYVWAYNECGNSTVVQLTQPTNSCLSDDCGVVSFVYNGNSVNYGTRISANNKCWLDRNLGATQVATSSTDASAYGDLFQWGRLDDGHQERTSPTTTTLSNSDVPGHNMFIKVSSSPYDWRSPQNNNLWQGEGGTNNPCPDGYRLPTKAEWDTERASWSTNNAAGAFASPLKLPVAGYRYYFDGSVDDEGLWGFYWSSTVNGVNAWIQSLVSYDASMYSYRRAYGLSVRCIKD